MLSKKDFGGLCKISIGRASSIQKADCDDSIVAYPQDASDFFRQHRPKAVIAEAELRANLNDGLSFTVLASRPAAVVHVFVITSNVSRLSFRPRRRLRRVISFMTGNL